MSKILRQNVGGVDFTMAGCALTGVCPTAAADYVKQITLSDGDVIEDGMMMVVTFANGNSAGNAPSAKTIYSSDQVNYFEDDQLTVPFTLAPEGCYEIEYTGTANAYTYTDYPVFQVGSVIGPVCDYRGHITSGDLWSAGDSVQCMLKEGKFLLLGGSGGDDIDFYDTEQDIIDDLPNLQDDTWVATPDTGDEFAQPVDVVESGNMHAVTSNAVAESLSYSTTEQATGGKWIDGKPIYRWCGYPSSSLTFTPQARQQTIALTNFNTNVKSDVDKIIQIQVAPNSSGLIGGFRTPTINATGVNVTYNYENGMGVSTTALIVLEYTKTTD